MRQTKQAVTAAIIGTLIGAIVIGCNADDCTTEVVPNMLVTVVDEQGNGVADPKLRVEAQRGNDGQWLACSSLPNDYPENDISSPSPTWLCGADTAGTYNVRATLGELSGRTDGVRVKMADKCHVKTRDVELLLQ